MEMCRDFNGTKFIPPSCYPSSSTGVNYKPWYHTFLLILAFFIVSHNALVIHVYINNRAIRTCSNLFVVNLCAADLVTGLTMIPSTVISGTFSGKNNGFVYLYFASNVISDYCTALAVVGLTLVIGERYAALCRPFLHERIMHCIQRRSLTKLIILALWAAILVIALLPLSWNYQNLASAASNDNFSTSLTNDTIHSIAILSCCFMAPAVLMLYFLFSMASMTYKIRKNPNVFPRRGREGNIRVTLLCLVMYVSFLSCWSPMMIFRLLIDIEEEPEDLPSEALQGLFAMRCATSLFNPVWYAWLKKEYRQYILRVKPLQYFLKKRCCQGNTFSPNNEARTTKETIWRETTL